jgi:hypothetical protein
MTPQRLIELADQKGDFHTLEDGYVYWKGVPAYQLRWLAAELDKRNAEWDATVNAYFMGDERGDETPTTAPQ